MSRRQTTLTIGNGASVSGAANIGEWPIYAVHIGGAFTDAALGFQMLDPDRTNYTDVYTSAGLRKQIPVGALSAKRTFLMNWGDDAAISGPIKLTSINATTGEAVDQGQAVTITVYQRSHL